MIVRSWAIIENENLETTIISCKVGIFGLTTLFCYGPSCEVLNGCPVMLLPPIKSFIFTIPLSIGSVLMTIDKILGISQQIWLALKKTMPFPSTKSNNLME